ncbi:phosphatase PAP2 family protein [Pedobacter punctiformis]|uniref:Phosphatase PAP2 family protein n=1 Tax=Pedobacter punctiformis TaxID=3004097 RepID=A0ABT4LA92_9SPHI|nr:phosphatase PAP2 family protein [Pedobacter sp. HCMS5-2]MCZ4244083.1 phosphatase PAP2 family protein [Pedobacter sp. HCMS5-2]
MYKTFLTWLIFGATLSPCFAQKIDSVQTFPVDSAGQWNAKEEIPKNKFKPATFIVPVVLMGYGFAAVYDHGALKQLDVSTRAELQEDHPLFAAHVDDYLQFAPAAAVYALNLSGIKGKHNLFDASMLYVTSAAIMGVSTHFVKHGVGRMRPDESGINSFPSGHTASAFMAAEFLHQEYKDVNPWIGYAGYFVATATGTLRMYNNKHWFSDVVAGAGFGIASTKIAYLVYPYVKSIFTTKKTDHFTIMPFHQQGETGLMLSGRF